jgi:hypothetical protein
LEGRGGTGKANGWVLTEPDDLGNLRLLPLVATAFKDLIQNTERALLGLPYGRTTNYEGLKSAALQAQDQIWTAEQGHLPSELDKKRTTWGAAVDLHELLHGLVRRQLLAHQRDDEGGGLAEQQRGLLHVDRPRGAYAG